MATGDTGDAIPQQLPNLPEPAQIWSIPPAPFAQTPPDQTLFAQTLRPPLPRGVLAKAAAAIIAAGAVAAAGIALATPATGSAKTTTVSADSSVRALWRTVSADTLLPATLDREGTETYLRIGIDADESCAQLPTALTAALKPAACSRVIQATYLDQTRTVVATVGIVVIAGSVADRLDLFQTWTASGDAKNTDMMPHTYPVTGTATAAFQDAQRVAWNSEVSTDGSYLVYTVAGFADGRTGPSAADRASGTGSALSASSPPVQTAGDLPDAIGNILAKKEQSAQNGTS